jgi:hypothetical protein
MRTHWRDQCSFQGSGACIQSSGHTCRVHDLLGFLWSIATPSRILSSIAQRLSVKAAPQHMLLEGTLRVSARASKTDDRVHLRQLRQFSELTWTEATSTYFASWLRTQSAPSHTASYACACGYTGVVTSSAVGLYRHLAERSAAKLRASDHAAQDCVMLC